MDTQTAETISDYLNPDYLFSVTETALLLDIAAGRVDANAIARAELANRGLNAAGAWVGFKAAAEVWNVK